MICSLTVVGEESGGSAIVASKKLSGTGSSCLALKDQGDRRPAVVGGEADAI